MYHFIGIKGSGMSALAQIMHSIGYKVEGSDKETHFFTEEGLIKLGIKILPFDANNINEDLIIVKGNAFDSSNVEVKKAEELKIPIYTYQEMVAKVIKDFYTIAVCGCHGKTTTSSLLSLVLDNIFGCNYLIGDGRGYALKENKYFVLEACEYKRHFLAYFPKATIITNIELDHVDYYKDINDVIDAYSQFVNQTEDLILACGDDKYTRHIKTNKKIIYYGIDDSNDIIAKNIVYKKEGIKFDVFIENNYYGTFDLNFYGKHMLLNSLAVIGYCYYKNIDYKLVLENLKKFKGAKRRFSITEIDNNVIIDDYAHHPTELKACMSAARQKFPDKKLIVVFQPHTFSRTLEFKDEYQKVLSEADKAYIMDIHPSREKQEDYKSVTSDILINGIDNSEHINIDEENKLAQYENSVILFMSPNDITTLENNLKAKIKAKI